MGINKGLPTPTERHGLDIHFSLIRNDFLYLRPRNLILFIDRITQDKRIVRISAIITPVVAVVRRFDTDINRGNAIIITDFVQSLPA